MGMSLDQMGANEWLIVTGAVLGPILAVQVQKVVEALSEGTRHRERLFHVLMGTRQSRLSPEHVGALNSIDLAFYDAGFGPFRYQPAKFKAVRKAWADYRRGLTRDQGDKEDSDADARFAARTEELFVNLLDKMAEAVGYRFDRHELQTSIYSPIAHGKNEEAQIALRDGLIAVLEGRRSFPMDVRAFPQDPEMTERVVAAQEQLVTAVQALTEMLDSQRSQVGNIEAPQKTKRAVLRDPDDLSQGAAMRHHPRD